MKRFTIKSIIFLIPFGITGLIALALAVHIGLFLSFKEIAELQKDENTVLFDAPLIQSGVYKEAVIEVRQPDFMIIGSSRILSFRNEFCNLQPGNFYNAGLRTLDVESMDYYTRMYIDAASPEVLILALDQPAFAKKYDRFWPDIINYNISEPRRIGGAVYRFVQDLPTLTLIQWTNLLEQQEPVFGDEAIGTGAFAEGMGYRNDGSYQFTEAEATVDRQEIARLFQTPSAIFIKDTKTNETTFDELDNLLEYAVEHGVYVIGFFPPYSPDAYGEHFESHPQDYTYLPKATNELNSLFDKYGFSFYDFTMPETLGITNSIMLDEWHMSERSALLVYQALVEREDILDSCSETDYLQDLLDDSEHPFLVSTLN